jgi:hypothetical protein
MKHLLLAVAAMGCITIANAQTSSDPKRSVKWEKSDLQTQGYPEEGIRVQAENLRAARGKTYDWMRYNWLKCDAKWNGSCEGTVLLEAPQGWQACRLLYRIGEVNGGAAFSTVQTSWYTNDPESPDRFRAFSIHLVARGGGNPFDQKGVSVRLENVGIRLLPANATNADRYAEGCEMPVHD